jgi:pimeloyl-ACP methyl ester carboxylesterase
VICFDRPGFGHSTRPRLRRWTPEAQAALFAAALSKLGVHAPIVVGHSWGALVALALARCSAVKGLVLVGGYYFNMRRKDVWLVSGLAIPVLGDMLRYTLAPIVSALLLPMLLRRIFHPRSVPEAFRRGVPIALTLRPLSLRAAAEDAVFMLPAAARLSAHYAALARPVALIAGEDDRVIEPDQALRLQRTLPHAVIHVIPAAGHMVHYDVPEEVAEAIDVINERPDP